MPDFRTRMHADSSLIEQRDQARFERDVMKSQAIQLRQALLWAQERLIPSGLINAEERYSLDAILEKTKALDG